MTDDTARLTGGCACGAVRYRLSSAPIFVNCCHCSLCQRQTGSAFVVNAMIEADRVELTAGTTELTDGPGGSGIAQRIHRCPRCRVALWSHFRGRTALAFVRVGTLDTPAALPPQAVVFATTRLPWVSLPDGVPSFPGMYDPAQTWPAEGLARVQAALDHPA